MALTQLLTKFNTTQNYGAFGPFSPPPSKIKRPDKMEKMDDKMVKFYVNTEPDVCHSEIFVNLS